MCHFAAQGRCRFGQACRFAHSNDELENLIEEKDQPRENAADTEVVRVPQPPATQPEVVVEPPTAVASELEYDFQTDSSEAMSDSDESTKASTEASVSTPRGHASGDQASVHEILRRSDPTTMILRNVPDCLTQGALVSLFEDLSPCMRATFDFFYLPWNPHQGRNLGYAIINFFDPACAAVFKREWNSKDLTRGFGCERGLQIVPAILQGRVANIRHFSGFSLALHANLRFRPLLRLSPHDPLRAMYVAPGQIQMLAAHSRV